MSDKSIKEIELELMQVSAEITALKEVLAEIRRAQASDTGMEKEYMNRLLAVYREKLAEKDAEIEGLKKYIELNSSMLAKQTDLAREAEVKAMESAYKLGVANSEIQSLRTKLEAKLWENQALDREIKRLKGGA